MSDASPVKLAVMGTAALAAVIIAIVVGMNTFSDGSSSGAKPSTEPIAGTWARSEQQPEQMGAGPGMVGPIPGMGMQVPGAKPPLMAKDIAVLDASSVDSGSVTLEIEGGKKIQAKVLTSQAGFLLLQVDGDKGTAIQLNVGQMGKGGPVVVSDGLTQVHFTRKE